MQHNRLLVITGVQNDFFSPPFGSTRFTSILPKIAFFVQNWDGDIIVVKETRLTKELIEMGNGTIPDVKPWDESREHVTVGYPEHCVKWTAGWEIIQDLLIELQKKNEKQCKFRTVEAYGQTWHDWANHIATYEQITICGTKLEDQILATVFAIRAVRPEVQIRVPLQLCASEYSRDFNQAISILENHVALI